MSEDHATPQRRLMVGVIVPAILLGCTALVLMVVDLPDVVVRHWTADGRPDVTVGVARFRVTTLGLSAFGGAMVVGAVALRQHPRPGKVRPFIGVGVLIQAYALGTAVLVGWLNAGGAAGRAVVARPLWVVIAMACGVLLVAVIAAWVATPLERQPSPGELTLPSTGLGEGQQAVLYERLVVRWWYLAALPPAVYGVVLLWYGGELHEIVVLLFVAVWVAQFAIVEVMVGAGGLTARLGWLGLAVQLIALDDIRAATVEYLASWRYGGMGYRGSRKLFGRAALTTRPGLALHVEIADGTVFEVSMNHAETAAGVLNDLIGAGDSNETHR